MLLIHCDKISSNLRGNLIRQRIILGGLSKQDFGGLNLFFRIGCVRRENIGGEIRKVIIPRRRNISNFTFWLQNCDLSIMSCLKYLRMMYFFFVHQQKLWDSGMGGLYYCHLRSLNTVHKWILRIIYGKLIRFLNAQLYDISSILDVRSLFVYIQDN